MTDLPQSIPTTEEIETFHRDGAVLLKQVLRVSTLFKMRLFYIDHLASQESIVLRRYPISYII